MQFCFFCLEQSRKYSSVSLVIEIGASDSLLHETDPLKTELQRRNWLLRIKKENGFVPKGISTRHNPRHKTFYFAM